MSNRDGLRNAQWTKRLGGWIAVAVVSCALPAGAADEAPASEAPVAAPSSAPAPEAAASAAPAAAPVFNVVAVNPEDLADYSKTIVVPTVYVKLLVQGKAFVAKQSSGLLSLGRRGSNSAKASAKYKVEGIDKAMAQAIAQKAQDDFVAQLRAAGYTVLTYADVKDKDIFKNAAREQLDANWGLPMETSGSGNETYVVAAPTDEQQFKFTGFGGGVFGEFVGMGKPKFAEATLIIPQYTIVAPQVWAESGSSYSSISAEIKTAPGMNLQYASVPWLGKPKVRVMGGIPGVTTKEAAINITDNAGTFAKTDTTPTAGNAISKGLSFLSGFGSINASSADYVFTIEPARYAEGANKGIAAFNAEVAKIAGAQATQ